MPVGTTGFAFGAFDLFNIEHVDALRQARQCCTHLVVGIATDDLVERTGGRRPFVPETERLEIVSALRWIAAARRLNSLDLLAAATAAGADTVFLPDQHLDVVQLAANPVRQLDGTGIGVVRVRASRSTGSVAVRSALEAAGGRSSVA